MSELPARRSLPKRILLFCGGLIAFILLFVVACRIAVNEIFSGIEQSRATRLSAVVWDPTAMWSSGSGGLPPYSSHDISGSAVDSSIARSAELRTRSSSFDHSVAALYQTVSAHHAYLEDLRTENRSGFGRALAASVSAPPAEFDATLADLKKLGRVEAVSEAGEDSAVKLATSGRHITAVQTNLARLQKLQREQKGELRDAVALEKDIAQASDSLAEAQRQHEALLATVAQAHIRVTLIEDYRAPFDANFSGELLTLRNSLVLGIRAIFNSIALILGVVFEFGLPLLFWLVLLFYPAKLAWRKFHPKPLPAPAAT